MKRVIKNGPRYTAGSKNVGTDWPKLHAIQDKTKVIGLEGNNNRNSSRLEPQ